jgi:hypothetical protein
MPFRNILLFILVLSFQVSCYAESISAFGYDSTIVKEWNEGSIRYRVEITIRNAADEKGVIPGQRTESYISIKKTRTINKRTTILMERKDSCDAQMLQLVFYTGCFQLKDLDKDGKKELYLLYEFSGDGFDDRKAFYLVLEGDKLYRSVVTVKYQGQFTVNTKQDRFMSSLPKKFQPYLKDEYERIRMCLEVN